MKGLSLVKQRVTYAPYPMLFKDLFGTIQIANASSLIFFLKIPNFLFPNDMVGVTEQEYASLNPYWSESHQEKVSNLEQKVIETKHMHKEKNMGLLLKTNALIVFDLIKEPVFRNGAVIGFLSHCILKELPLYELYDAYIVHYPKDKYGIHVGKEAFIKFFQLTSYFHMTDFTDKKIRVLLNMLSFIILQQLVRGINQHTYYKYSKMFKESLMSGHRFQDVFYSMIQKYKNQKQSLDSDLLEIYTKHPLNIDDEVA